jgi:hypothetical protein
MAPPAVPALPDTQRITSYSISASTGPFAVNFAIYGDGGDYGNWLEVWLNDVALVATVDYTLTSVSGPLASIARPITDGSITLTVAGTGPLIIIGARRPRRLNQFNENQGVPARDFNQVLTDIFADQREAWDFARTRQLYFPGGETGLNTQLPTATNRINTVLSFDGSGNPFVQPIVVGGNAGAISLSITRAQIPNFTMTSNTIIVSGYTTVNDFGLGAIYTSVGAGPSGPLAIQDHSGTWFNLAKAPIVSVGWFGATGNGSTDDTSAIQAAVNYTFHQATSNLLSQAALNRGALYFPPGQYIVSSAISLGGIFGGWIFGAGKLSTQIITNATSSNIFTCNGFAHCVVERIGFVDNVGSNTAIVIQLTSGAVFPTTQGNAITNCFFQGFSIGVNVGLASGANCSENEFRDCHFTSCSTAGLKVSQANALGNTVYNGNFQSCGIGVWVNFGSAPIISGVGFQLNGWDIQVDNAAQDTYCVSGCRTESLQFINAQQGSWAVVGCTQQNNSATTFITGNPHVFSLVGCISGGQTAGTGGVVNISTGSATMVSCEWGQPQSAHTFRGTINNCRFNGTQAGVSSLLIHFQYISGNASLADPFLIQGPSQLLQFTDTEINGGNWAFGPYVTGTTPYFYFNFPGLSNAGIAWNYDGHASYQTVSGAVIGWSSSATAADGAAKDTGLSRSAANKIAIGNGTPGDASGELKAAQLTTAAVAVASLPIVGTAGRRAFVNNATVTTFATIVAGGGTNLVPVYDDGTNWRIG